MTDRIATPTEPPQSVQPEGENSPASGRFSIVCDGHEVPLPRGMLIMGRGSRCHIVVDDLLTSREHARLTVTEQGVVIEDLGSTNGVFVNEHRISSPTSVVRGDRIIVGSQEMELNERVMPPAQQPPAQEPPAQDLAAQEPPASDSTRVAVIVPVSKPRDPLLDLDEPGFVSPSPSPSGETIETKKADVILTLGRLADRMLTMGRFDAAERVLQNQLEEVLAGVRSGLRIGPDVFESCVEYALRLAEVTHKGKWIDYVVAMHEVDVRVMDGPIIARLDVLLRTLRGQVDRQTLHSYQTALHDKRPELSLAGQVACDRILELALPG